MDQDIRDYIKNQGVERLLFLIKDADNYDEGVGDEARKELLARGYSEEDIEGFINRETSGQPDMEGGPLDSVWMKYREMNSARGMLMLVVLLMVLFVLKTLLSYALLHFREGVEFGFTTSLFGIFLPMTLGAFSAYAIWKLMPIGWIFGHAFSYFILILSGIQVYGYVLYFAMMNERDFSPVEAELDLNFLITRLLDVGIAIFVLVQLNRKKHMSQFNLNAGSIQLTRYLMPFLLLIVLIGIRLLGLL